MRHKLEATHWTGHVCQALFLLFAIVFVASQLLGRTPLGTVLAGIQALLLMLFVLAHGSLIQGWRGIAVFAGITLVISFLLEASSIATGFPFGFYTHLVTDVPKPAGVAIAAVLGYVFLGWLAWCVASVIGRDDPADGRGAARWTTPIIAAFVLTGFDYPYDPIGSTVMHMWKFRIPSGTFGVPLTNYLGWLFTGWLFFQLFALVEHRFAARPRLRGAWAMPALIWLLLAVQYPFMLARAPTGLSAQGDRIFVTADIYEAAVSASLFGLVLPALIALVRLLAAQERTRS